MVRWFFGVVILLLAGWAIESSLLVYAGYVLGGLLLAARWLARAGVDSLSAVRILKCAGARDETTDHDGLALEIGERVVVRVVIRNEGTMPVSWVLIEDALPGGSTDRRFPKLEVKGRRLAIESIRAGGEILLKYTIVCLERGFHQIGPVVLESGDLFGMHRRFRILTDPKFILVYPRVVPLTGYDIVSRRPIGDVRMTHKLFEDPTRIAGVREYQYGDPLSRVHWKATARTGSLHCKVLEPSTLSGITVLLDFYAADYHQQGEPIRSELAVTVAVSLVHAVYLLGQQVGLIINARDAAERIKTGGWNPSPSNRNQARQTAGQSNASQRLEPLIVPTGRGTDAFQRIRETLARAELTDAFTFANMIIDNAHRLPRDATALAVLPEVTEATAIALGNLKRRGMAVAVVLVMMDDDGLERAHKRLTAEGIRDLRHCANEQELPELARKAVHRLSPYDLT